MAVLVGIDEAGYGPLLGPLVVSSAAFALPESLLRENLWENLEKAVSKQKKGLSGRLLITDSKKAFNRKTGPGHLRRTVLAALTAIQENTAPPANAWQLTQHLCPNCAARLTNNYPWYESLANQPLDHDQNDIQITSGVLQRTLAEKGIELQSIQSRCLDVGFYNNRVKAVRNKSRVLFTELCSLIYDILQKTDQNETVQVIVDRQGGRINYQPELLRMFPGTSLSVLRQEEKMSSYELDYEGHLMRIHFCMKADTKYLPVSLASMASKYLREVLMEAINTFFCNRCPDLKPTAGYWQDGQRFIKDLKEMLPEYNYNPENLVRIA